MASNFVVVHDDNVVRSTPPDEEQFQRSAQTFLGKHAVKIVWTLLSALVLSVGFVAVRSWQLGTEYANYKNKTTSLEASQIKAETKLIDHEKEHARVDKAIADLVTITTVSANNYQWIMKSLERVEASIAKQGIRNEIHSSPESVHGARDH